jgi:uncharacterized protein
MTTTTILTYTGVAFDLLDPRPEDVKLADLTVPMSGILRFNAHLARSVNLLQHSKLVFDLVGWKAKPYALLHDAHEAYIGDIATPVAAALAGISWGAFGAIATLKDGLDEAIYDAFGLRMPESDIIEEVTEADRMALSIERQAFADPGPEELWIGLPDPLPLDVPSCTRAEFAVLLRQWCPRVPS